MRPIEPDEALRGYQDALAALGVAMAKLRARKPAHEPEFALSMHGALLVLTICAGDDLVKRRRSRAWAYESIDRCIKICLAINPDMPGIEHARDPVWGTEDT